MKKILIICVILLSSTLLWSQQYPQLTNYRYNYFLINPAAAGSYGTWAFKANLRNQWTKFPGSPVTGFFSADGNIGRVGLGGVLYSDVVGPEKMYGAQMAYAYHIPMGETYNLSIGVAGRASRYTLDRELISTLDPNDPAVMNLREEMVADIALGLYLYGGDFFGGIAVPQLVQIANSESKELERHYYLMLGYNFEINENFSLEPQAQVRYIDDAPVGYDVILKGLFINEQLMFGVGYRAENFLSFMTGFNVDERFKFVYSYDYHTGELQPSTWGSHEVMLGVLLKKRTRSGAE